MSDPDARLYFDFIDPLSWLAEITLAEIEASRALRVERVGYELRPPPAPLTAISDPIWTSRWESARRHGPLVTFDPPPLVPWTRKAHELQVLAESRGVGAHTRCGIFEAYFVRGIDIGRIDVLVEIAVATGLDRTETKAALDVDGHEEDVLTNRRAAEGIGLEDLPAISIGGRLVRAFQNPADLGTLLGGLP